MKKPSVQLLALLSDETDSPLTDTHMESLLTLEAAMHRASTLRQAREAIKQSPIDLIVIDSAIATGGEISAAQALRREGYEAPIVLLVHSGQESLALEALDKTIDDFLFVPTLDACRLERAMKNALEKSRLRSLAAKQKQQLQKLSNVDELTGLFNRRVLLEKLTHEVQRSARYHLPLSVLLLDLDFFKSVNDKHGHETGDHVLNESALTLKSQLRATDIAGRYSGEEFCVVLTNTDLRGAERISGRIRSSIARLDFRSSKKESFQITCSIGAAQYQKGMQDPSTLLTKADQALHEAKTNGRNCVKLAW